MARVLRAIAAIVVLGLIQFFDFPRQEDPPIVISVSITPGVNSVAFGEQLTAKLDVLESQLPIGYELEYATFQPELVESAVNGGLSNVYQTIGIVLAVVMVFLRVRTGLIGFRLKRIKSF